ncbi:hypothetical protein [Gordonia insulae]|uniref:Uncharacterized protein n=1 Tax=Gordonia insulae TaxID=2420509 RepID=A0A3G8JR99_9ACTN|nr:hypothetical protein [Gordonia insulae]AZG47463.1 hypothetical protein D7316_04073 [Gordonia insulae]
MSDFINKIKEEARAVSAAIDQELTVLEGVDGYDALREEDEAADGDSANGDSGDGDSGDDEDTGSDDTEGGGSGTEK